MSTIVENTEDLASSAGSFAPKSADVPGASRSGSFKALALILLIGGALRIALWMWFQGEPLHVWDERDYNQIATNLVKHGEFSFEPGAPISLRPPLYPFLVAGVYAMCGVENFQAVRLLNGLLGLMTVVVLYGLGVRVASRKTAIWLAGLCCFYPSLLIESNLLLTETLFTLLLCSVCYTLVLFYQEGRIAYLVLAGVFLGLAALTRSVVWMSPPFLAGFVVLTWKATWPRRIAAALTLLAAFAATLAPWSIRNSRLQGTFVAVDVMGGRNFMMGNYQHTPLYRSWDAISISGDKSWAFEIEANYPYEQRDTQGKVDRLALRQGLKFVRENPWLTLKRDIIKFFDFWGLERELVAGAAQGYWGELPKSAIVILAALILGCYAAVMALGIFGMCLSPLADRRLHWLFILVIAYICGMHTLVFAHSRYHLPIMPLVMVFAALTIVNARAIWQKRRSWSFWAAGGLCCLLAAGWLWNLMAGDAQRLLSLLQSV